MATLTVRMPEELHKALKACSQQNHRSMQGEVLRILEEQLRSTVLLFRDKYYDDDLDAFIAPDDPRWVPKSERSVDA